MLREENRVWWHWFGPGAVIASLSIGTGELIFSSRAGALFGYKFLWVFALVLLLKWALVYGSARHMALTGAHPLERWLESSGPAGWLPGIFGLFAVLCFPVWVSFHAGTIGTLWAHLSGTSQWLKGGAFYVWGIATLAAVMALALSGGYSRLERVQTAVVGLMLLTVVAALLWMRPDWFALLRGLFVPEAIRYPEWIGAYSEIASRPIWVEAVTYVGVIGGSGYDYLAYVAYLREKRWGRAGQPVAGADELENVARDPDHADRKWLRAVALDSGLSFLAVFVFTVVFVACGAMVLGPAQTVPSGTSLLDLQAVLVSSIYPWLRWIYFSGALLAMLGTLYGTIEVAPVILRELVVAGKWRGPDAKALRRRAILWVGLGGLAILAFSAAWVWLPGGGRAPSLVALVTPANLFTGVLACGVICWSNVWYDRRRLPQPLRMARAVRCLNGLGALLFVLLGLKAYWDQSGWWAFVVLAFTLLAGWGIRERWRR